MHAKAWLADDCVAMIGSCNGTPNSMDQCFEIMVATRALQVTKSLRASFDTLWAEAAPLDLEALEEVSENRRARSLSRSASRSLSRTASAVQRGRSQEFPGTAASAVRPALPDPGAT